MGDIEGHQGNFWGHEVTGVWRWHQGDTWGPWDMWVTLVDVEDKRGHRWPRGHMGGLA